MRFPSVAISAAGDTVVVYGGSSGVEAVWRGAGGNGSAWARLAACGGDPQVGLDASGLAIAIWEECGTSPQRLMAATRSPGLNGAWGTPVALSTPGRPAFEPRLSVNRRGDAVASWAEWADEFEVIQASTRSGSTGAWEPAVQLSSTGAWAYESVSTIDEQGDVAVAFTRSDPSGPIVWCAYERAGGAWQPSVQLSQPGDYAVIPDVALDRQGNTVAVWNENGSGMSSFRSHATGQWETPIPYPSNFSTDIATDSKGNALAAWSDGTAVWASERPPGAGSTWTEGSSIAKVSAAAGVHVDFDGTDDAIVLWDQWGDGATYPLGSISAARRVAGTRSWEPPATLDNVSADMEWVRYAVDSEGNAVVVWEQYAWPRAVESAILDSMAPVLESLNAPSRVKVGRTARYSVSFHDLSRTTVRWQFGDGRSAAGTDVRHVYRRAGYFRVRVSATDAAGHVATSSHRIRVLP